MKKNISFATVIVLVLSILLAGCSAAPAPTEPAVEPEPLLDVADNVVSASAEVVAGKSANLSFMLGGPQVDLFVKVGDNVRKGKVLASFPDNALPQAIINAQADLILAQDALDNLQRADTALAKAVIDLRKAQKEYDLAFDDRDELNYEITFTEIVTKVENTPFGKIEIPQEKKYKGYATKDMIAKADENLALKQAVLDDIKREVERLSSLQNSPDVLAAKTRVAAIESVINQSKLVAPFDGTIVDLYANTGEMISPGVPVMLLADLSTLQVKTTDLNEVDVARVQVGDTVKVTFDALPDTVVEGNVSEISLKNATGSGVYFDIFITLKEIPERLRWGMSAFVEIQVSK